MASVTAYWESLRAGRAAPYRKDLDPAGFEDALENMFILEHFNGNDFRIRLAGRRLNEWLGRELRGLPPSVLFETADHETLAALIARVIAEPARAELALSATDGSGRALTAELLFLPLLSDDHRISRILGCLLPSTIAVVPPVSFTIVQSAVTTVRAEEKTASTLPGFAEESDAFLPESHQEPRSAVIHSIDGNPVANRDKPRAGGHILKLVPRG